MQKSHKKSRVQHMSRWHWCRNKSIRMRWSHFRDKTSELQCDLRYIVHIALTLTKYKLSWLPSKTKLWLCGKPFPQVNVEAARNISQIYNYWSVRQSSRKITFGNSLKLQEKYTFPTFLTSICLSCNQWSGPKRLLQLFHLNTGLTYEQLFFFPPVTSIIWWPLQI